MAAHTAHHVITQIQSDLAHKKDSQCLPSLVKNTIENLAENNLTLEELLADGSYSSGEALQALEDHNIEGYIPNFGQYTNTTGKVLVMIKKTTNTFAAKVKNYRLKK